MRRNVEADGEKERESNINSSEKNNSKNSIAFDNNFIDKSLTFSPEMKKIGSKIILKENQNFLKDISKTITVTFRW